MLFFFSLQIFKSKENKSLNVAYQYQFQRHTLNVPNRSENLYILPKKSADANGISRAMQKEF